MTSVNIREDVFYKFVEIAKSQNKTIKDVPNMINEQLSKDVGLSL
jgi:hypothetical protein